MRTMLRHILVLLIILSLGYFGMGLLVVLWMTSPSRKFPEATPASIGLVYTEVELRSTDGVRLSAWWVLVEGSSLAAVLVPGWGGHKFDEHLMQTVPVYHDAGYSVLLLDLRAQGESGGARRTLGYREVRDLRGALAWLQRRGYALGQVMLHGWSMGGATVLRAAPGTGVAAVVEEAGYADLPLLLRDRLPESSGLPSFFNPGMFLMAKLFLDFDPWAMRPSEDAAKLAEEGVPFLIVHSRDDKVVPFEHAEMFAAS